MNTSSTDRIKEELAQLQPRITNLELYLENTVSLQTLNQYDHEDLRNQLNIMHAYEAVLNRRLRRALSSE